MTRFGVVVRTACALTILSSAAHAASIVADFATTNGNFVGGTNWAHSAPAWGLTGANGLNSSLTSPTLTASGGEVTLQFAHTTNFESGWDGAQLEMNVNGGAFTKVPGSAFSQNGYNLAGSLPSGVLSAGVFTGLQGPMTSIASLGTLNTGDTFAIRFHNASDGSVTNSGLNWQITRVELSNTDLASGFSLSTVPEPGTAGLVVLGGLIAAYARRRR